MSTSTLEAPTRRRRDPEATRQAILAAAEKVFIEKGPSATSMNEIAREAGVTKSLIHHHFGSKDELWMEVRLHHFQHYFEQQKAMLEASSEGGGELLRQSVVTLFRYLQSDPREVRFLSWRTIEEQDPCLELEDELFKLGMERLRQSQAEGKLRDDVEPISIIKAFLGMVFHWHQTRNFLCQIMGDDCQPDELDEKFLDDAVKILLEGVLPR